MSTKKMYDGMLIERIQNTFGLTVPVFTQELLRLFADYSRSQVFRLIDAARKRGEIVQYIRGVYFIPQRTRIGDTTITAEDVIRKRYLRNNDDVFGVYSGIKLLNTFAVTTQMAGTVEVVTNNESAEFRKIQIKGRCFILHKSRCKINKDNFAAYTVMQLFDEMEKEDRLDDFSMYKLQEYIAKNGISQNQLISIAKVFPEKTVRRMIESGIICDDIRKINYP